MNMEFIGNGRTADVIQYSETTVLKLFKPFIKNKFIEQEFHLASFAFQNGINTPQPLKMVNEKDRVGIEYRRVYGKPLLRVLSENSLQIPKVARQMAQLHSQINQVIYNDTKNSLKANIINSIQSVSSMSENDKTRIINYLLTLPDKNNLCHGDFHPDNILINEKLWIIDWMTGSSGNPLCDIARTKLILETSELPNSITFKMRFLLKLSQKKLADNYVREYCKIGNIKRKDVDSWLLPLYAARLNENLSENETETINKKIKQEMKKRLTAVST